MKLHGKKKNAKFKRRGWWKKRSRKIAPTDFYLEKCMSPSPWKSLAKMYMFIPHQLFIYPFDWYFTPYLRIFPVPYLTLLGITMMRGSYRHLADRHSNAKIYTLFLHTYQCENCGGEFVIFVACSRWFFVRTNSCRRRLTSDEATAPANPWKSMSCGNNQAMFTILKDCSFKHSCV